MGNIDQIMAKRESIVRRRQAAEAELDKRKDLSAEGKAKVARQINEAYQRDIANLRAEAEKSLAEERQAIEVSRAKLHGERARKDRELLAQVPAAQVLIMERIIQSSTVAELATWYKSIAADPASALAARQLLQAHVKSATFDQAEWRPLAELSRILDTDRAADQPALTTIADAETALKAAESQLKNLDPYDRSSELLQRFKLDYDPPRPAGDFTASELAAARSDLGKHLAVVIGRQ